MANHRWANLVGIVSTLSRATLFKIVGGLVGVMALAGLAYFGLFGGNLLGKLKEVDLTRQPPQALKTISVAQDAKYMATVADQVNTQHEQGQAIKRLGDANEQLRKQLQDALNKPPPKSGATLDDVNRLINRQLQLAQAQPPAAPPPEPPQPILSSRFEPPVGSPSAEPSLKPDREGRQAEPTEYAVALGAGSVAEGMAMNGFIAQSGGESESVAIALTSDLSGPNASSVPTTGCRVVAECDAKDVIARGRCEVQVMTCTLAGGKLKTINVSGWITAQDNVNGEFGTVIWNDKEVFKRIAHATLPAVIAKLLKLTETTVTATSATGVVTQGVTSPLGDISREIGDLLLDRIRAFIFPIVAVDRHQRVHFYVRSTAYVRDTTPRDWVYIAPNRSLHPYN